jgi:hypothetical protein
MLLLKFFVFRCVFEAIFKVKVSRVIYIYFFYINSMFYLDLVALFVWML